MKPKFKVASHEGKEMCNQQLLVARDMILQQALQTMLIYGIAKLEMRDAHLGHTKALSPKATDITIEGLSRPKALSDTRNSVFTHWSQILYLYGITEVEMNPTETEMEKIKVLWQKMNEAPSV